MARHAGLHLVSVGKLSERRPNTKLLTALITLLVAIPSALIIGPLGSAGTPADVLGLVMLVLWACHRILAPRDPARRVNPVALAMVLFVGAVLASYIAAARRPIAPLEMSAADRGLLLSIAWLGMLLFAMEALRTTDGLDTIMRRLTFAGAGLALVGLAQFVTKMPLVNFIRVPGLRTNADLADALGTRGSLTRPPGTAVHPIEFGAVLTMILPIALHYALHDHHRRLARRWLPVAAIAVAVPISLSRSALLSTAIALIVLLPTWPARLRRRAYVAVVGVFGCLYLVVHGLLSELTSLFLGVSTDSSAASRTNSYGLAMDFIGRSPWFGRGFRTFLPEYRILDDQLLGTAVEMGLVGLAALIALMVTGVVSCYRARRHMSDPVTRQLGQALVASVAAASCSFALYDALSFPMAACTFFLVLGCAAAYVRLADMRVGSTKNSSGPVTARRTTIGGSATDPVGDP
jgi:polysaccharide biosynthesis protein PslJ